MVSKRLRIATVFLYSREQSSPPLEEYPQGEVVRAYVIILYSLTTPAGATRRPSNGGELTLYLRRRQKSPLHIVKGGTVGNGGVDGAQGAIAPLGRQLPPGGSAVPLLNKKGTLFSGRLNGTKRYVFVHPFF